MGESLIFSHQLTSEVPAAGSFLHAVDSSHKFSGFPMFAALSLCDFDGALLQAFLCFSDIQYTSL